MRDRALCLLIWTSPPLVLGIVVMLGLIVGADARGVPGAAGCAGDLVGGGVLAGRAAGLDDVALAPGAATAVLSTAAFDFFRVPPALGFAPAGPEGPVAFVIFCPSRYCPALSRRRRGRGPARPISRAGG
jgi:hypothetical protein